MASLDEIADDVLDNFIDPALNVSREDIPKKLEPNVDLEPQYYGKAHTMHCENVTIREIMPLHDSGSYVAKAIVQTAYHGIIPLRFTTHTLTITCRDSGVLHPADLVGQTVGVTYGDDPYGYFSDGNVDLCFTNFEKDEKMLVDAKHVHNHRIDKFGHSAADTTPPLGT